MQASCHAGFCALLADDVKVRVLHVRACLVHQLAVVALLILVTVAGDRRPVALELAFCLSVTFVNLLTVEKRKNDQSVIHIG